jgi:hypothetical protein
MNIGTKGFYACILVLLGFGCVYAFSMPRVAVSPNKADMGMLHRGEKRAVSVSLRNSGHRTLRILKVDTMCECTTAEIGKRSLRPGESARIRICLDSSALSGKVDRLVCVKTNVLANGTIFIPVSCEVMGK